MTLSNAKRPALLLGLVFVVFVVNWLLDGTIDLLFTGLFGLGWIGKAINDIVAIAIAVVIGLRLAGDFPKKWLAGVAVAVAALMGNGAVPSAVYYAFMDKVEFEVASAPVGSGDAFRVDLRDTQTGEVFEVVAQDVVHFPFVFNYDSGTVQARIRVAHKVAPLCLHEHGYPINFSYA